MQKIYPFLFLVFLIASSTSNAAPPSISKEFHFDKSGPFEFLCYLIQLESRGVKKTTVGDAPDGWIKKEHLGLLVLLLDSKEPCASVGSGRSSKIFVKVPGDDTPDPSWKSSTVGHEAAYLIASYRHGVYPMYAANTSATVELDKKALKEWIATLLVKGDQAEKDDAMKNQGKSE